MSSPDTGGGGAAEGADAPERRASRRRRFRDDDGRRAPRRPRAPLRRGLTLVAVVLVVSFGFRAACRGPASAARGELATHAADIADLVARTSLPWAMLPAFGMPNDAPPASPPHQPHDDVATTTTLAARLRLAHRAAPSEPAVALALGQLELALGEDRAARLAFEAASVHGDPDQRECAWLGMAVLAARAGLARASEQDRRFALEHALALSSRVRAEGPQGPAAAFDRALWLLWLDRPADAAREAAAAPADAPLLDRALANPASLLPDEPSTYDPQSEQQP